jgi:hypothetical protein
VHLVLEGTDLEFVKKGSLTSRDLLVLGDDLNVGDNLDLRLDNLGLDVKGLEEGSLLGVKTGGSSGDGHIGGGEGTDTGGGLTDLGVKNALDLGEVSAGEDEASVEGHLLGDLFELLGGVGFPEVSDSLLDEGLY